MHPFGQRLWSYERISFQLLHINMLCRLTAPICPFSIDVTPPSPLECHTSFSLSSLKLRVKDNHSSNNEFRAWFIHLPWTATNKNVWFTIHQFLTAIKVEKNTVLDVPSWCSRNYVKDIKIRRAEVKTTMWTRENPWTSSRKKVGKHLVPVYSLKCILFIVLGHFFLTL